MNTEPLPDPEEPTVAIPGLPTPQHPVDWSRVRLVVAVLITIASMLIAAEFGSLLSTFGLAGVALALAAGLTITGVLVLTRFMLPIGLVTAALALPAAIVALDTHRIDRSAGLLSVTPRTASDIDGRRFHQGVGSVFLDLRKMAARDNQTITVNAQSDTGTVVVALPRDRCFNLRIRSRVLDQTGGPGRTALRIAGIDTPPAVDVGASEEFFQAPQASAGFPGQFQGAAARGTLIAFGRRIGEPTWQRRSDTPSAPTLVLDLQGARASLVRDYPDGVGPLGEWNGQQVGGASWPASVELPRSPGELRTAHQWRPRWTDAHRRAGIPQRWIAWERDAITQAEAQSKRAAGVCAPREALASTWTQIGYQAGPRFRVVAVNGLGTVTRWEWTPEGNLTRSDAPVVATLDPREPR